MATKKKSPPQSKFQLDLDIHHIQAQLPENTELKIEAKCGNSFKHATNPSAYSTSSSQTQFNSKFSGQIKLKPKGSSYSKKLLKLKVSSVSASSEIGSVGIDISHLPNFKGPIKKREIKVNNCVDKSAVICISLTLTLIEAAAAEDEAKLEQKPKKKNKNPSVYEMEEKARDDSDNESVSSMMSFSEFIINPKESDVKSESSSSEEECKTLPRARLKDVNGPKITMGEVTPNQESKAHVIEDMEKKNGISQTREKGNCVNCVIS